MPLHYDVQVCGAVSDWVGWLSRPFFFGGTYFMRDIKDCVNARVRLSCVYLTNS